MSFFHQVSFWRLLDGNAFANFGYEFIGATARVLSVKYVGIKKLFAAKYIAQTVTHCRLDVCVR